MRSLSLRVKFGNWWRQPGARAITALLLLLLANRAWCVEVYPGDYTALPPGTNVGVVYYETAERTQSWARGDRQAGDPRLTSRVGIARYIHFMEVNGVLIDPQLVMSYGELDADKDISALGNRSSFGDPAFVTTAWVINDPVKQRYLGITPYVYFPLGNYDKSSVLNLGDNRWRFVLQAGYIQPLIGPLMLDLTADASWFGKNTDCAAACGSATSQTLRQDPLYHLQAAVRWPLAESTTLFVGAGRIFGGETRIDGVDQHNRQATTNMRVGVQQFLSKTTMLSVAYGRDLDIDNGFRETDRLNMRLNFTF
ncbi:transporter [Pseudomonas aeruginosa]|uniref:transporter n=1 Tax=Pseudomonas aeruginosa TaxID=287 RepID=UPI00093614FB|nr:transporter [Pseudomonas aeruginosa]